MCDDNARSIKHKLIRGNIMVESSINGVVDSISIIYDGYDSIIVKWFAECFLKILIVLTYCNGVLECLMNAYLIPELLSIALVIILPFVVCIEFI